ncbi:transcriptional regulator [Amycolatopsis sp. WAC 01416]|uniref:helix-turn-helix domain-containing protein n=1 Tax=Amycolatopsis sp. WAC 01416 TaxID=2203196 RepID=UPI000F798DEF|nr:helix-turn-helix transcriptional regulator [Amycolatopsis sp. WAC 01416]RSN36476.1 transcriptional regulator [Amycolatopsis sp. WAC 01416]
MTNQDQLSTELRRLRKAAGLSGTEAARLTGLSQSKVSRVETGAFMPTEDQVVALCRAYRAPAKVRRALVAITRDLREEASSARVVLQRGAWRMQQRIGKIETASARIRSFQPTIVFGLLQTRDYITALFDDSLPSDERDQTVEARLERQRILDSSRDFHFVLTEGALRWNMGGAATMLAQLGHLIEVSRRGRVRLGVIPWTTPVSVAVLHGFDIYDSRAVLLGTQTATALVTDEREVADYEKNFAEVERYATYGDVACSHLTRIAADYRQLAVEPLR